MYSLQSLHSTHINAVSPMTGMCCTSNASECVCAVLRQDPAADMGDHAAECATMAVHANLDSKGKQKQHSLSFTSVTCLGCSACHQHLNNSCIDTHIPAYLYRCDIERPHEQGNTSMQNVHTAKPDTVPCELHLLVTEVGF